MFLVVRAGIQRHENVFSIDELANELVLCNEKMDSINAGMTGYLSGKKK